MIAPILLIIAVMIGLPALVHLRRGRPHLLFAAATIAYGLLAVLILGAQKQITLSSGNADRSFTDTYYVVSKADFAWSLALVFALIWAVVYLQTRLGAMRHPRLTCGLFWGLHLGLLLPFSLTTLVMLIRQPRRYIDYPEYIEQMIMINLRFTHIAQACLVGLIVLLIWSGVMRLLRGPAL